MTNQAFSKIWIIVISLVLIAGGIFAWQYFGIPREESKKEVIEEISNEFLIVLSPSPNQKIKSPVSVSGKSNFFEANTRIRIKDESGKILADTFTTAEGYIDKLYPFSKNVYYQMPSIEKGIVEVFEESAKYGKEVNKISIPVIFEDYGESEILNWKTYRNEEYGYEIKYPPMDWEQKELYEGKVGPGDGEREQITQFSFIPRGKPFVEAEDGIIVNITYREINPAIMEDYIQGSLEHFKFLAWSYTPKWSKFELDDFSGLKGVIQENNTIEILAFRKFPTLFFKISAEIVDPDNKKGYEETFNQMLSTFRFLE